MKIKTIYLLGCGLIFVFFLIFILIQLLQPLPLLKSYIYKDLYLKIDVPKSWVEGVGCMNPGLISPGVLGEVGFAMPTFPPQQFVKQMFIVKVANTRLNPAILAGIDDLNLDKYIVETKKIVIDGTDAEIKYFFPKKDINTYHDGVAIGYKGQLVLEVSELQKAGQYYYFGWHRELPTNLLERRKIDRLFRKIILSVKINPEDPRMYCQKALNAYFSRSYEEAIGLYSKAIALDGKYALAYAGRAVTYYRLSNKPDRVTKTLEDYDKAISLDPKNGEWYFGRGKVYLDLKDLDKALADYDKSVQFSDNSVHVIGRGKVYALKGDYEKAIADYTTRINDVPHDYYVLGLRANAYMKSEKYDMAWQDIKRVKELGHSVDNALFVELKKLSGRDE